MATIYSYVKSDITTYWGVIIETAYEIIHKHKKTLNIRIKVGKRWFLFFRLDEIAVFYKHILNDWDWLNKSNE